MNQENQLGYVCFYNDKKIELYANSMYDAKKKAVEQFKAPPKKAHMVSVMLAEKNGETVIHSTSSL